jgi:putative chitobiose transport system substrate-binding protein
MPLLKRFWPIGALLLLALLFVLNVKGLFRPSPVEPTGITLTFWTLQLRDFAPLIQSWINTYEATHPNQHIRWVDLPFNEGEKRALTAMLSPNVPDVINLNPAFSSTLAERNVLATFPESMLQGYAPALMNALRSTRTGHAYALPWYTTTKLHFYNSHLLTEAQARQLATGAPPDANTLAHLKQQGAYGVFPLVSAGGNALKALQQLHPSYATKDEVTQAVQGVLKPVALGIHQGWIPKDVITGQYSGALELYMAGRLGILEAGSSALNTLKNNAPTVYAHTRLLPSLPNGVKDVGVRDASPMVLVVPAKSKHPAESMAFARFITQTRFQLQLSEKAPVLPSTTAGLASFYKQPSTTIEAAALKESAYRVLSAKRILPVYPNQASLNDASNAIAQAYLLQQPKTFQQQLNTLYPVLIR